ncbi:MAG: ATP phosphoribosyltransferase regulatory subunit [Gemmobacter sp.]|nr:ATP phosphoribosyltransferase regulatory subunit [Gemmobacter sp.]
MPVSTAARAEAERLFAAFRDAGAVAVETDILQPAEILLDLYGEDIRGRAYVTSDPLRGEMMLRPDFTVPVVQMHMTHGADPARYCYMGEVFRRQDHRGPRANEYLQVGYEVFTRDDPAAADAEVFDLFDRLLAPLRPRAAMGDIGVLMAAVQGLDTTDLRRAALLRHIWRPRRFRALLDRYAGRAAPSEARIRMLQSLAAGPVADLIAAAGPMIGQRGPDEIAARVAALLEDADTPAIHADQAAMLDRLLALTAPAPEALDALRALAIDMPALTPSLDGLEARLSALETLGVRLGKITFEASHGRAAMEYYDGLVFSFHAEGGDLPPIASGGRYDALTRVLGQGRSIPAVGGIIRPGVVALLREGRA